MFCYKNEFFVNHSVVFLWTKTRSKSLREVDLIYWKELTKVKGVTPKEDNVVFILEQTNETYISQRPNDSIRQFRESIQFSIQFMRALGRQTKLPKWNAVVLRL